MEEKIVYDVFDNDGEAYRAFVTKREAQLLDLDGNRRFRFLNELKRRVQGPAERWASVDADSSAAAAANSSEWLPSGVKVPSGKGIPPSKRSERPTQSTHDHKMKWTQAQAKIFLEALKPYRRMIRSRYPGTEFWGTIADYLSKEEGPIVSGSQLAEKMRNLKSSFKSAKRSWALYPLMSYLFDDPIPDDEAGDTSLSNSTASFFNGIRDQCHSSPTNVEPAAVNTSIHMPGSFVNEISFDIHGSRQLLQETFSPLQGKNSFAILGMKDAEVSNMTFHMGMQLTQTDEVPQKVSSIQRSCLSLDNVFRPLSENFTLTEPTSPCEKDARSSSETSKGKLPLPVAELLEKVSYMRRSDDVLENIPQKHPLEETCDMYDVVFSPVKTGKSIDNERTTSANEDLPAEVCELGNDFANMSVENWEDLPSDNENPHDAGVVMTPSKSQPKKKSKQAGNKVGNIHSTPPQTPKRKVPKSSLVFHQTESRDFINEFKLQKKAVQKDVACIPIAVWKSISSNLMERGHSNMDWKVCRARFERMNTFFIDTLLPVNGVLAGSKWDFYDDFLYIHNLPQDFTTPASRVASEPASKIWVERAVLNLISEYKKRLRHFQGTGSTIRKTTLYSEIAAELQKNGIAVTGKQCQDHMDNVLIVQFRKEYDKQKKTGAAPSTWDYYHQMLDLFDGNPTLEAPYAVSVCRGLKYTVEGEGKDIDDRQTRTRKTLNISKL
ncbi:hypothetical protein ONE63_011313 [Megalurothrips usitatus]|uniref:Myb/SANT-like DNA-binding domain-containing protein n=1 Tax=Megalurothrips usitatus TaxID=439358 RepID=A0AAV7X0A9_9NEOP|nr:hypothetical protein ONE63_011313 [Megalurothrips usitatus]